MVSRRALHVQRQALLTKLANCQRVGIKIANIGGDESGAFEQSFATLAFNYVQDKAPKLLDYLVGFQLVDRNDDNTKAFGIFGFQLGDEWLYAPMFFLNGKLKGHEMLYLKNEDMFVPLKENWINYLLARKPHMLGEGTPRSMTQLGIRQPDLQRLSIPPQNAKYAYDLAVAAGKVDLHGLRPWAVEARDLLRKTAHTDISALPKYAGLSERLDLARAVARDFWVAKAAVDACQRYPRLKEALSHFYGPTMLVDSLQQLRKNVQASDSILATPAQQPDSVQYAKSDDILAEKRAVGKPVTIRINDDRLITTNGPGLSEEERERLLRDGYLVDDPRTGDEVSKAYNTQIYLELSNPTETSLYDVLTKEGTFERLLVIVNPHGSNGRFNFLTVVRPDGDKGWVNVDRTELWVKNQDTREEFLEWCDEKGRASLEKNGYYVALSKNGQGSVVFRVEEALEDGAYYVDYREWVDDRYRASFSYQRPERSPQPYFGRTMLRINDREGSSFRSVQGVLYLPKDCAILRVQAPPEPTEKEKADCCCHPLPMGTESPPIEPGNLADLQAVITQKTAELKIWHDHSEVVINRQRFTKLAGLFHLIRTHAFREADAKELLKTAEKYNGAKFRVVYPDYVVKTADPYYNFPAGDPKFEQYATGEGPGGPGFPEQQMDTVPNYFGTPATYPQTDMRYVPELASANTDPMIYDNTLPPPDPMAMQVAQQAATTNQKEVFDTAALGSMLKSVREESLVGRYLDDLLKSVDRVLRILFLFYWHGEAFEDRYGKADLPELEDTLRNAAEVMGDLVLFLKTKAAGPETDRLENNDIEEAARI